MKNTKLPVWTSRCTAKKGITWKPKGKGETLSFTWRERKFV
jgi:hypothetical protein